MLKKCSINIWKKKKIPIQELGAYYNKYGACYNKYTVDLGLKEKGTKIE